MPPRAPAFSLDSLRQAATQVAGELHCRLVLLFGSATHSPAPEDLDLGLLGEGAPDVVGATNALTRALGAQAVEVVDLARANPLLLMLAARDGVALYEGSPGEFARFASLAARRYADTHKFREAEQQEVLDFIARGDGRPVTGLDAQFARRKLATINRSLDLLASVEALSPTEYRADALRRKGAERLLQEIVEAAVDTNLHLLRAAGAPAAGDYYPTFIAAGRHGIVPPALAEALAPAAGLRNRLVHEYDAIDDAIVLAAIARARRDFATYVAAVQQYLSGRGH